MNIQDVRENLKVLSYYVQDEESDEAWDKLRVFINEVEELLKHNSIKQTPALLRK